MNPLLPLLLALFFPFLAPAQELLWDDGWTVTATHGAYIQSDHICPMRTSPFQHIHSTDHLQVSKQLTSAFSLALDYQYQYRRHIVTPMLRTDLFNFYRTWQYLLKPHMLNLDLGVGWGHYNAPDDNPIDHNYHVYVARLSYTRYFTQQVAYTIEAGANARTYAHHIGIARDRTDLYLRIGITYRIISRRCPRNILSVQ